MRRFYVYILASLSRTLYVGVTSDLPRRVYEHKHKLRGGFTARYNVNRLVYYETTENSRAAIEREKGDQGLDAQEATGPGREHESRVGRPRGDDATGGVSGPRGLGHAARLIRCGRRFGGMEPATWRGA